MADDGQVRGIASRLVQSVAAQAEKSWQFKVDVKLGDEWVGATIPGAFGELVMLWTRSNRFDPAALPLADRHYNRRVVGSPQFVPPGRCVVLLTLDRKAVWVTSWPLAEYVRHAWAGAWVNSLFRNEGAGLSSDLIRQAVAATLAEWLEPPDLGIVTFVDARKTRRKRDPGRCYRRAGFEHVGFTAGGLWALQLLPRNFPAPEPALVNPGPLFATGSQDAQGGNP